MDIQHTLNVSIKPWRQGRWMVGGKENLEIQLHCNEVFPKVRSVSSNLMTKCPMPVIGWNSHIGVCRLGSHDCRGFVKHMTPVVWKSVYICPKE